MSTKISAFTDGTTAQSADKIPVARSGANRYITPAYIATYLVSSGSLGLVAQAHNNAAQTVNSAAVDIINFNTVDYDPLSTITTGASWKFTAPITGRYDIRLCNCYIDPNGASYAAGDGASVNVYKNGASVFELGYYDAETTTGTTHWVFFAGSQSISLTAGDTIALKCDNFSASARKVGINAYVEVHRVA